MMRATRKQATDIAEGLARGLGAILAAIGYIATGAVLVTLSVAVAFASWLPLAFAVWCVFKLLK